MYFIKPISITDPILTASNVTEADAAEWLSGTAFTIGQTCMVTTTANGASVANHRIYTAQGSTTGDDPTVDDGTNWVSAGFTNRFKMFDSVVQSQTTRAGGIEVELTPGGYSNSLSLINVDAASVDVVMDSAADGEVYNQSFSLTAYSGITDWYAYYFTAIERTTRLLITDMPPYSDATVTVTINDAGTAAVGELVLGNFFQIGQSLNGASFGIIDYSVKNTAADGTISITQRAYARRSEVDVLCETSRTATINDTLASIRSTPVVWVADTNNSATIVYGYFREFNTIISDYRSSIVSLQIEGLT